MYLLTFSWLFSHTAEARSKGSIVTLPTAAPAGILIYPKTVVDLCAGRDCLNQNVQARYWKITSQFSCSPFGLALHVLWQTLALIVGLNTFCQLTFAYKPSTVAGLNDQATWRNRSSDVIIFVSPIRLTSQNNGASILASSVQYVQSQTFQKSDKVTGICAIAELWWTQILIVRQTNESDDTQKLICFPNFVYPSYQTNLERSVVYTFPNRCKHPL